MIIKQARVTAMHCYRIDTVMTVDFDRGLGQIGKWA